MIKFCAKYFLLTFVLINIVQSYSANNLNVMFKYQKSIEIYNFIYNKNDIKYRILC